VRERTKARLKRYPSNWRELVAAVHARSGGRCECMGECGLHGGERSPSCAEGSHEECHWPISCPCSCHDLPGAERSTRCTERNGYPADWARGTVMLTTAHLCHDETCANLEHLRHLCQRCHLRYDQPLHQAHALETREARRRAGTLGLFEEAP
jgi:hypothetical protein